MKTLLAIVALAGVTAVGCKQEPEPQVEPAEVAPAEPAPAAEQPATAIPTDLPTLEDYEEEAAEDITVENMEEELDRLEAEIAG
jgi:hypothetical protein